MKRLLPSGLAWALAVVALAAISGSAFAYFSSNGLGSASAAVSKLTTPAITAATPAVGGTVSLAWSAATAPGAEAVKYYVTRDGEEPDGTCAAPAVPTAATSCVDSGLEVGSHVYTVTAVWRSWSSTSSTRSATISIGVATHFTIAAASLTPAVSVADNLTITAKDENEKTVTTYTGSKSLIFSGAASSPGGTAPTVANSSGTATAFGKATALTFALGVASVSSSKNGLMKLYRVGVAEITASDGTIETDAPVTVTVTPGVAAKYTLTAATTTPTAGAGDDLTVTALDAYGNIASAYGGLHELVFANTGGTVSPGGNVATVSDSDGDDIPFGTATAIEFSAGVATTEGDENGEMRLYKSGAASIKAAEGSLTNSTALTGTVAAAPATKLVLTATTLTPVAAASDNLTTTAKDPYENTATSYAGAKELTFSGALASPSGTAPTIVNNAGVATSFGSPTALTFTAGVAAVGSSKNGLVKLSRAGETSITVSDGSISTVAPVVFTVTVGAVARWALTELTASAGSVALPCLFTCPITVLGNSGTVTAKVAVTDSVGNIVSAVGSGHTAKAVATGTTGSTVTGGTALAIPATGLAVSSTSFTYTAPAGGAFSNTITISAAAGTAYTTATATASK